MDTAREDTLEQARKAVSQVARVDLSDRAPDAPLNLDSIIRISLIAELEAVFDIELPDDAIEPEVFESLESIVRLVEERRT